jgi:hypothetical protein
MFLAVLSTTVYILDAPNQSTFPIGAPGAFAVDTGDGGFAALRRIGIRDRTWLGWLYPLNL